MDGPTLMNLRAAEIGTRRLLIFFSNRKLWIGKEEEVCLRQVRENNRGKYNQITLYEILN